MGKVALIARLLLGFVFLASGIAFFFTTPPPLEGRMAEFFTGMTATGYMFYLIKGTEIVCGALLLSGFFVPLALVVLAPVLVNIILVHAFMAPEGLWLGLVLGALEFYLAFFSPYSGPIKALFRKK